MPLSRRGGYAAKLAVRFTYSSKGQGFYGIRAD
jgi:hypothetical protein